jgi:gliding motility-associated protein GldM
MIAASRYFFMKLRFSLYSFKLKPLIMASTKLPPRQRMINMMYLVLTAMLALNVTAEVLNAFKTVDDGIGRSNQSLATKNASLFGDFQMQMQLDAKKAEPFKLKAEESQKICKALYDQLEQYKQQVIKEAGGYGPRSGQLVSNDNIDIATRIFVEENNGKIIKEAIQKSREQLLALPVADDKMQFISSLPLLVDEPTDGMSWEFHKFNHIPTVAAVTLLSKYQNDALAAENQLVEYFLKKIDYGVHKMDRLTAMINSPSNYIMQGLPYKANVMLTAYSSTQNPDVFIGAFTGEVKKNSSGSYEEIASKTEAPPLNNPQKTDVSNGLGQLTMPGNNVGESKYTGVIRVKDPSGNGYIFYPFEGRYQVAAKTAVVSPTMMNVLYSGLENPVSVSVPGVAQKDIDVSFDGPGAIEKKADGSYVVHVKGRGAAKVKVSARIGGSIVNMGEQDFRVKRMPDPITTLDGAYLGGSIRINDLRSTKGVVAKLVDFDYPAHFKIDEYTATYRSVDGTLIKETIKGPLYNSTIRNIIDKRIRKGEALFLDDIYAIGPDGEKRKLTPIAFLINS